MIFRMEIEVPEFTGKQQEQQARAEAGKNAGLRDDACSKFCAVEIRQPHD
jgi:hypothetical protein